MTLIRAGGIPSKTVDPSYYTGFVWRRRWRRVHAAAQSLFGNALLTQPCHGNRNDKWPRR